MSGWCGGFDPGFSGPTRNLRNKIGSRETPYTPPSDPQFSYPVDPQTPLDQANLCDLPPQPSQDYELGRDMNRSLPPFYQQYLGPERLQPIHGSTFITAETVNNHHKEAGIDTLHRAVALEALNYSIHWLHGPAGAGKSALMQTLCQQLKDAGRLGGSFFFKRDHLTRGNAKVLFATLAYQLALHRDELKDSIAQCMETDPSVVARGMDVQLRTLILEPCRLLQDTTPLILLIDGLDECAGHIIQQELLHLISSTTSDRCLRILIASRPEPHIREIFHGNSFRGLHNSINIEQSFDDVRTYLRDEFSRIHRNHRTMQSIATPWPSPEVLEMLVEKSSGYFIYASTVIKFVDDEYSRPSTQLGIIQNIAPDNSELPFQALDQLYTQILSGVPMRYHSRLCDILSVIINYPWQISPEEIDELLGFQSGDASLILRPLHSVLKLPSDKDNITVHHASFRDFLGSKERSSIYYAGAPERREQLAQSILKALAYTHDDQQKNQARLRLCWSLSGDVWIDYVTSVPPSVEFVPLIRLVNPDFIFVYHINLCTLHDFLSWLKGMVPTPEDLIQHWEDYCFIHLYDHCRSQVIINLLKARDQLSPERTDTEVLTPSIHVIHALQKQMNSKSQATLEACRKLLLQSPNLMYIFHLKRLMLIGGPHISNSKFMQLFEIRAFLDLSWDDIQKCICPLHPLVAQDCDFFSALFLSLPALHLELDSLYPQAIVSRDLACRFFYLMQRFKTKICPWCGNSLINGLGPTENGVNMFGLLHHQTLA
ncbi:hypothetical protein B0H14DRAFT_3173945 [Mycena olivaceomarginata]|nr:hypothetical protein B0H14DRAFT_3173945 [Mycena olivaceomarginata]